MSSPVHIFRARDLATHDLKNGVPRLQLYRKLLLGGSVMTKFGVQRLTEFVDTCVPKSRGSTGNSTPPIWNASVCDLLQEYLLPPRLSWIFATTSWGPRISELPCGSSHEEGKRDETY